MRTILLDVDTGVDDALAILYAVAHPDLEVLGVSCVNGNAPLPRVLTNTCAVLDAAEAGRLPVAAGADRPLVEPVHGSTSHGANGLGDIELPPSARILDPAGAVGMLRREIMAANRRATLVALAPLTNVALLLRTHPEVIERLQRIVVLGGSTEGEAEFNFGQDPEAAWIVVHAGVPLVLYPLEIFLQVVVTEDLAAGLAGQTHPALRLAGQLLGRRRSRNGEDRYLGLIGDVGALVFLTHPEHFTVRERAAEVGLEGDRRGRLTIEPVATDRTCVAVIEAVDAEAVAKAYVSALLGGYPSP